MEPNKPGTKQATTQKRPHMGYSTAIGLDQSLNGGCGANQDSLNHSASEKFIIQWSTTNYNASGQFKSKHSKIIDYFANVSKYSSDSMVIFEWDLSS
jgi:hypothetical protein